MFSWDCWNHASSLPKFCLRCPWRILLLCACAQFYADSSNLCVCLYLVLSYCSLVYIWQLFFCTGSVSEILLNSIISLSYVYYTAITSLSDSCALGRLDRARGPFSYCQGPGWCRSPLEHRCGPEDALSSKPRLIPFLPYWCINPSFLYCINSFRSPAVSREFC